MDRQIKISEFKTPFGNLILGSYEHKLCLCDWKNRKMRKIIDDRIKNYLKAEYIEEGSTVLTECSKQLTEYFNRDRMEFDIPLLMIGSDFQKMVWYKLLQIPYGTTLSYSDLSIKLLNRKAVRAIASANGANPISIIVPCHRIIGSNGKMIGYGGGRRTKFKLLELEKVIFNDQLSLF